MGHHVRRADESRAGTSIGIIRRIQTVTWLLRSEGMQISSPVIAIAGGWRSLPF